MKYLIDINEQSKKGKLAINMLKEMGITAQQMPAAVSFAVPSAKKITSNELNYLLDEADISESILLSDGIVKYKTRKKK